MLDKQKIVLKTGTHTHTHTHTFVAQWCSGYHYITIAQLHLTKPESRFCAGSNPARGVSEIRDGEDL